MTIQEFIDSLKELNICFYNREEKKGRYEIYFDFDSIRNEELTEDSFIYARHLIGGVSGGSCWETSNPQPFYNDEPDPELSKELDIILENICPNVSYLCYKDISKKITSDDETEQEYYGNCADYRIHYLRIKDLFA